MSNYRGRSVNYTPRMSDDEALDLLGPRVRRALQEAVTSWSAYWALRMTRKHGADWVIAAIRKGDEEYCRKGFEPARGKRKAMPSSFVECRVSILRANWAAV